MFNFFLQAAPADASHEPALAIMGEVTGGRNYVISSLKALTQCLENLFATPKPPAPMSPLLQQGVVVNFEEWTASGAPGFKCLHRLLHVRQNPRTPGFFPIPESFWLDSSLLQIVSTLVAILRH